MKIVDFNRLRLRIILITISFSLFPLIILGIGINKKFSSSYYGTIESSLRILAESKQASIDLFLSERVAQLSLLSNSLDSRKLNDQGALERLLAQIQSQTHSYIDIGIIDTGTGKHLAYTGPYNLESFNYKNEEWFAKVMAKGVYISDVFMGFRKHPHIIIAVLHREGDKSWILRATIDSEIFEGLVKRVQIGRKGDAFLVNAAQILQTTPRFGGTVFQNAGLPFPIADRFQGAHVESIEMGYNRYLYAWTWLDNTDWLLVIREDPAEELRPLLDAEYQVWLLLGGAMLLIGIGTVLVTNSMIRRLVEAERERAALDANLTQSGKMAALGKMAAGVAHEINNPLAIIREQAGWVKDLLEEEDVQGSPNFKEIEQAVDRIEQHVERAKNVTHRMLGFARRVEPTTSTIHINALATETLKFLETEARHRNIDITMALADAPPCTVSDQVQLQQVLLNLIDNAIDAMGKNGRLTIATAHHPESHELSVAVTDTGSGIPPDKLEKIFDPFYTTKKLGEGTGLGLAIAYGIMDKLGGRITVSSVLGQGSTFTLFVPVR